MTRFLSLCSQQCASSRPYKSAKWLETLCRDYDVEDDDIKIGLVIACAGSIGCAKSDQLDVLAALNSLIESDLVLKDEEKGKKMKGRLLECTSCLMRWGKVLGLHDLFDNVKKNKRI